MVNIGKENEREQIRNAIKDLWELLTEEQKSYLMKFVSLQRFKKNESIYHEGDTPEYLFCLAKGKVKIFKEGIGGQRIAPGQNLKLQVLRVTNIVLPLPLLTQRLSV